MGSPEYIGKKIITDCNQILNVIGSGITIERVQEKTYEHEDPINMMYGRTFLLLFVMVKTEEGVTRLCEKVLFFF